MSKILLVDDEEDIRTLIALHLKASGYEIAQAEDGLKGLEKCLSWQPDLAILDLTMPRLSGLELCRRLRQDGRFKFLPIIMLTAKAQEPDRVLGFEVGADDYVTKPFSLRELGLRVEALLRRSALKPDNATVPEDAILIFDGLTINPQNHEVCFEGKTIALTALEFRLIYYLAQRPGRVLSRTQLLEAVWGYHEENYARTVDTHMRRLRQKLGLAEYFLETVRGVGYRFSTKN